MTGGILARYSDDGEPQGTAGMPTLDAIRKSGACDICVVVTRYFGGTLLGTGGLVRAYTGAAKLALDEAGIKKMLLHDEFDVTIPYSIFDNAKYICQECGCDFTDAQYTDYCNIADF